MMRARAGCLRWQVECRPILPAPDIAACCRFTDFPFTTEVVRDSRDARRFCGHAEVLAYLDAFAEFHGLRPHIRYRRCVLRALPLWGNQRDDGSGPRWRVTTCFAGHASQVRCCTPRACASRTALWVPVCQIMGPAIAHMNEHC